MKKRIFAVLTALILLCACLPLGAVSVSAKESGTTRDCTWTLDGTHLTISGDGYMDSYDPKWTELPTDVCESTAPWGTNITEVTIEEGVKNLGKGAFVNCTSLTKVNLPKSLVVINEYAFYKCSALTSITIPDEVLEIRYRAFYKCFSLTSLVFPNKLTCIDLAAFMDCYDLQTVTLPNSIQEISTAAFSGCYKLEQVYYDGFREERDNISINDDEINNVEWEYLRFEFEGYRCKKKNNQITIMDCPDDISGVVELPETINGIDVTTIGEKAFEKATALNGVVLGEKVTKIQKEAFSGCAALREITIPKGITAIGEGAFADCDALRNVYYGGNEEDWRNLQIGANNQALLDAEMEYNHGRFPWIWLAVGVAVFGSGSALVFAFLKKKKAKEMVQ